jgi:uncharacterized oligopeptide transporter (OPT) family protein
MVYELWLAVKLICSFTCMTASSFSYPEGQTSAEILRFAQNDKREGAQNDKREGAQDDRREGARNDRREGLRMIERNGTEITQPAAYVDAQSQRQPRRMIIWMWFRIRTLAFELCPGPVC